MGTVKDVKILTIVLLFAAACLALAAGGCGIGGRFERLESERVALNREREALMVEIARLMERKRALSAGLEALEKHVPAAPPNRLGLYAELQRAARESAVEVLSTRWDGPPPPQGETAAVTMALRGDYRDILRLLAVWRNLPAPPRVAGLAIRPGSAEDAPGTVEAEATLEALLSLP